MKGAKRLRGRGVFHRLRGSGKQESADSIICFFVSEANESATLNVGFAVSGSHTTAVQRNRIKRLMREAFNQESSTLQALLQAHTKQGALLFIFKENKSHPLGEVRFRDVHSDITKLARAVALKL